MMETPHLSVSISTETMLLFGLLLLLTFLLNLMSQIVLDAVSRPDTHEQRLTQLQTDQERFEEYMSQLTAEYVQRANDPAQHLRSRPRGEKSPAQSTTQ